MLLLPFDCGNCRNLLPLNPGKHSRILDRGLLLIIPGNLHLSNGLMGHDILAHARS